jgi:DNA-binding IclR family transcriptional regulator
VRDAGGLALGALIVAAPSSRLQSPRDELARLVREEAAAVSATLGFRSLDLQSKRT